MVVVAFVLVLLVEIKLVMEPDVAESAPPAAKLSVPETFKLETVTPVLDAVSAPLPALKLVAVSPVDDPVIAPLATFKNCMFEVVALVVDA